MTNETSNKPKPMTSSLRLGEDSIVGPNGESVATLLDFWRWSASNVLENTLRGVFAEFIVACSLGVHKKQRVEWEPFDLLSDENVRIEVKSAAYVQAWEQTHFSAISFDIRPTSLWDKKTRTYSATKERRSDLYIFCVLGCSDSWDVDPFELCQWAFYILPTSQLELKVPKQKTISLARLEKLGAAKCNYSQIGNEVLCVGTEQIKAI